MGQGHVLGAGGGGGRNMGGRKHVAARSGKDLENLGCLVGCAHTLHGRPSVDALGIWVGVVFPLWVTGSRV